MGEFATDKFGMLLYNLVKPKDKDSHTEACAPTSKITGGHEKKNAFQAHSDVRLRLRESGGWPQRRSLAAQSWRTRSVCCSVAWHCEQVRPCGRSKTHCPEDLAAANRKGSNDWGISTDFLNRFFNMASVTVWTKFPTQMGWSSLRRKIWPSVSWHAKQKRKTPLFIHSTEQFPALAENADSLDKRRKKKNNKTATKMKS